MPYFWERLLAERERLGMSQQALADAAKVTMRSQRNYEKGDRFPDAVYLAAIASVGADVRYIITGERDAPAPEVLTADERELLALFRAASLSVKAAAIGALQGGTGSATGYSVRGSRNNVAGGDMVVHAARGKAK